MNTTSKGKQAESVVVDWLTHNGYALIDQNWKTRWCEIDIIAKKANIVTFVEVRHRKSSTWGDGLESITPRKYKQVEFAANFWMHHNDWRGDARIVLIATAGDPPQITRIVEL